MRDSDPVQWERFVSLYSALIYECCRRGGLKQDDAADVAQEVFRSVASKIHEFRRDRPGDTFQGWLWGATRFKMLEHFRRVSRQPTANLRIHQLPDELDEESRVHDAALIYHRALELLETEFERHTWQAFWKTAIEENPAAEVAEELSMTVGAVYNAGYKVLRRLRTEFAGLLAVPDE